MSLEMVLMVPVFVAFLALLAGFGRQVDEQGDVDAAARDGARAASIARTPSGPEGPLALAQQAVTADLQGRNWCVNGPAVQLDSGTDFAPGGQVAIKVTCEVNLKDVMFVFSFGRTMSGRAVAPIDKYTYRGN